MEHPSTFNGLKTQASAQKHKVLTVQNNGKTIGIKANKTKLQAKSYTFEEKSNSKQQNQATNTL